MGSRRGNRLDPRIEELETLVAKIVDEGRRQGASDVEVSASDDEGLSVTARDGALETVEFNRDRGIGITLFFGARKGSASTTDCSWDAVVGAVAAAKAIAKHTQDDACNGLADAERMADFVPDLELDHPWEIDADHAAELAIACEAQGRERDPRIVNSDGATVSTQRTVRVYGNSHGFVAGYAGTRHGVSCMLIASDDAGMQRDYWYSVARSADQLEAVDSVGRIAADRALARLSPRTVPTGSYPVVYAAPIAGSLLGHLLSALAGTALYRKASFLLDSMGEQVMPSSVSVYEQPRLTCAMGSAPFDGDGVATQDKSFVADGVVESYVLSTYSARRLGLETTGNAGGVFNLSMDGPTTTAPDLQKKMQRGLIVNELMGQGVNLVTGDYSRGAAGFWVEDGEIAYPVDQVTIASNLKDMLKDIVAVGDDVDRRGNVQAPSILLGSMTLAGS